MLKDAQLAHAVGPRSPELLGLTIPQALGAAVKKWSDYESVVSVHQGIRWTYAELAKKAEALAAGLLKIGIEKGDRVGIWAPNIAQWTLTQFATAKIGAILVNVNPAYRLSELEFALHNVGIKAVVCPASYKTSMYAEMMETLAPEIVSGNADTDLDCAKLPDLKRVILIDETPRAGWNSIAGLMECSTAELVHRVNKIEAALSADEPINIQFTSGTTGLPKGATLTHRNILNNGYFVGLNIGLVAGDRLCIPVPLYHCFGMVMGNLACLVHGAAMVYPAETFDPGATLAAIEKEKCTGLYGVPTMFIAQLAHPDIKAVDLSSLRTGCMAGSPCPVEVMKQVVETMNMVDVTIAYGMTETSPVSFQSTPDDPISLRVATIGRVLPHLECKIVDEAGATVPPGTPGELCTRGYSVMLGYWGDEDKTAAVLDEDGWMHTGDLATIDAAGYGNIVGRIKDMIIRGGENIYPLEIEEFFFTHPDIEDATVFGVPDEKYGEEVCLWVRIREGATIPPDEISEFCKGQIAHYKIPRYIEIVDEFPMTVTGKIRKVEMRGIMSRKLGLVASETA
ncbi:AMP-binding protein [Parasphingorhabdus halotolerans]|uniref:3-methylmercaptopropionyl-CoA ligase n=1 Tax=Parasphingorhabdus halotolerans TaxID=2725558 RepID=A0A6H2DHU6_9SPHN|nr:AMP-binding protein [Parasphingorhabdus halotolerans]QJB68242.1 AMP-binding protein [Parasphingorhabdus halotolerans]